MLNRLSRSKIIAECLSKLNAIKTITNGVNIEAKAPEINIANIAFLPALFFILSVKNILAENSFDTTGILAFASIDLDKK